MAAKVILALCASALIVNVISGQCIGNGVNPGFSEVTNIGITGNGLGCGSSGLGYAANGLSLGANSLGLGTNGLGLGANGLGLGANGLGLGAAGLSAANLASSSGGSFTVSSTSPIAPSGLSVHSENCLDGPLTISGGLPFSSAVGVEGQVPASGASDVSYNCGNGNVGIVSENVAPATSVGVGSGLGAGLGAGLGVGLVTGQGAGLGAGLGNVGLGLGSPLAGRAIGGNYGAFARNRDCGTGVY